MDRCQQSVEKGVENDLAQGVLARASELFSLSSLSFRKNQNQKG